MYRDLDSTLKRFIRLSDEELEALHKRIVFEKIEKNTCLVDESIVAEQVFFVRKGYLRTFFKKGSEEITRDISSVNSFFTALTSFITRKPSFEIVSTITDCEVLSIKRDDLNYLYQQYINWQMLGRRIIEEMFVRSQKRIYSLITKSAEERYLKLMHEKPDILQNVPLQYIASYLGVTSQSLSRLRRKICFL